MNQKFIDECNNNFDDKVKSGKIINDHNSSYDAYMSGVDFVLQYYKKKKNEKKALLKAEKKHATKLMEQHIKLHLPRFGITNMCGINTTDARSSTEKIGDFWGCTIKHFRCEICLKAARARGDNVIENIKNFGGVL